MFLISNKILAIKSIGATSSRNSSPENLGRTVIDVQLREQQSLNNRLLDDLQQLQQKNKKLTDEITAMSKMHNETIFSLEEKLSVLQTELKQVRNFCQIEHVENIGNLLKTVNDLNTDLSNLYVSLSNAQRQIEEVESERDKYKKESNEFFNQISHIKQMNEELNKQLIEKDIQLGTIDGEKKDLINSHNELQQKMDDLKNISKELRTHLQENEQMKEELAKKIKVLAEKTAQLEEHQRELQHENNKMKLEEIPELQSSEEKLRNTLHAMELKKAELEVEMKSVSSLIR